MKRFEEIIAEAICEALTPFDSSSPGSMDPPEPEPKTSLKRRPHPLRGLGLLALLWRRRGPLDDHARTTPTPLPPLAYDTAEWP